MSEEEEKKAEEVKENANSDVLIKGTVTMVKELIENYKSIHKSEPQRQGITIYFPNAFPVHQIAVNKIVIDEVYNGKSDEE